MKTYTIACTDKKLQRKVQALWIISQLKLKGIKTLEKFMQVVLDEYPELDTFEHTRKLVLFWQFRNFDYNEQLEYLALKKIEL